MDSANNTTPTINKLEVARALTLSPSTEQVIMYETGKAFDIAMKLRELRSTMVTIVVLK